MYRRTDTGQTLDLRAADGPVGDADDPHYRSALLWRVPEVVTTNAEHSERFVEHVDKHEGLGRAGLTFRDFIPQVNGPSERFPKKLAAVLSDALAPGGVEPSPMVYRFMVLLRRMRHP